MPFVTEWSKRLLMQRLRHLIFAAGLLLVSGASSFLLSGCSGESINENDPAALYQDAENDIKGDHYVIALDKLKIVKNKFPYSNYSVLAQLRIADVYYLQENYVEASAAYETFRDLHPKHEKVPYAIYKTAMSYFNDTPSNIARDVTPSQKALDAFNELIRRFPTFENIADAQKNRIICLDKLAEKELYVGNFYFRRDLYDSAEPRYKKILELYPETNSAKTAREKLEKIASFRQNKN